MDAGWSDTVLRFWFEELSPDDWFSKTPEAIDRKIRERFLTLYEGLAAEPPPEAWGEPEAALAAIIVLDQFPRNMFRGTARAFAADTQAAALARNAVERELDAALAPERRRFLYLPLEHSEIAADQEHSVALYEALGDAGDIGYAVEHRDIIARFGRFPHRNRALGRESSEAEKKFLGEHKGFGQ